MDPERHSKIAVCQHKTQRVPRQADGSAFYRIYSGGMRAAEATHGAWYIEPVLDSGHPCSKGFLPLEALGPFFSQFGFEFIAFHHIGWTDGNYHSSWRPRIPGEVNHFRGPADLWISAARNLSRADEHHDQMASPTFEQSAAIFDDRTEAEQLATSISLSIRNMDISVEQIAEFYNEQLVNHMASGSLEGVRSSTSLDQTLFAHVQSFFMHLAAARDYLSALCALRIGKDPSKVDSFARLASSVREGDFSVDGLIAMLHKRGYFRRKSGGSSKFEPSGWMEEVTDLRNEFIHRRPFGDRFAEQFGFTQPMDVEAGIYRYVRPMIIDSSEEDVLSVILRHYREMTGLCHAAAVVSGYDVSMLTLTSADILSVKSSVR